LTDPGRSGRRSQPQKLALLVAVSSLLVTLGVLVWYQRRGAGLARSRFEAVARDITGRVQQRFGIYEYGLRGIGGAAVAVGFASMNAARYRGYEATRDLPREFPGARGMGLIRRVRPEGEAAFLRAAREEIGNDFSIKQLTPHGGERYVIEYIEPVEQNLKAVGLDIASERLRKTAADAAASAGEATLTGPIRLLQATQSQWGFLLLLPIYAPGAPRRTPAESHAATEGWSYAPLIAEEVLSDLTIDGLAAVALSDTNEPELGPFFTSASFERAPAAGLVLRLPLRIFGRTWTAEVRATPAFLAQLNLVAPGALAALGLCITALLTALSYVYSVGEQRRQEVRAEQARRAAIVAGSQDAVIAEGFDGVVTDWNAGAAALFGYSREEALGRSAASLILPPERADEDAQLRDAIARGALPRTFDTTRRHADGTLLDVSVSVSPIISADGRRLGFSKTIRDISGAKRAEQQVKALNASLERVLEERAAALQAAQRDIKSILDAVPSLIGYWDRNLDIRFANRAHEAWFGAAPDSLPSSHALRFFESAQSVLVPRLEAAWTGVAQTFEIELQTSSGPRHCEIHLVPDMVEGQVRGTYVLVHDNTAQRQAREELENALAEREALLTTVHEHAIVSITDGQGRILDVNAHFCRLAGYRRDELVGNSHAIINSGVHPPELWRDMWRTLAEGKSWRHVVCNRAKDGSLYWVDSIMAPLRRPNAHDVQYISIRFDVTATKRAEAALHHAHTRTALATDAAGIGIWELDIPRQQLTWDAWMYRIYGHHQREGELPGSVWSTSVLPEDRIRAQQEVTDALAGRRPFDTEFRILRSDGEVRHIKAVATVMRDEGGHPARMTGINMDITERKRAELELLATTSLLRNVLEAASEVSLIATDPSLTIKIFNRGAERLLGYRAQELVDRQTPVILHDGDEIRARANELSVLSGTPVEGAAAFIHPLALGQPREWTYVRKDGSRVPVSLVVTAMLGADGALFGYLGVAHDVTRQRHYEATLRGAMRKAEDASRAKSEFLANMSHEIRTPMNAVIGLSHLLEKTSLDAQQADLLQKSQIASKSLLALINDVLDFSKIEAGELTIERAAFDLPRLLTELRDIFAMQAASKGIDFRLALPPALPARVVGDSTRLNQILSNLLSNAIKFTERGGVELRVHDLVDAAGSGKILRFEVNDTGLGLDEEQRSRLFMPFVQADTSTTRRFGGTGLGLSIVKRLAELMGGSVGVTSAPHAGSSFWVRLPLTVDAGDAPYSHPAPDQHGSLEGVRVLVVDDSDLNLFVARGLLQRVGARIQLARNGAEAVEALRSDPTCVDIVLMDVQMPVMDGHEAAQRIRLELGLTQLPIVALTADVRASERQRVLGSGMAELLSKPFEPQKLIRCIQQLLGAPRAHSTVDLPLVVEQWPVIDGIDGADVRRRLGGDRALFLTMLRQFTEELAETPRLPPSPSPSDLESFRRRVHRLRGSAGLLGAKGINQLGAQIESHCRKGESKQTQALATELERALRRLCLDAAPFVQRQASIARAAPVDSGPLEGLERLVTLLTERSLGALDELTRVSAHVVRALGEEGFSSLRDRIQRLRFDEALALLAERRQKVEPAPTS
jgi:PAS domain S-box-containing protein